jgi:hypothetical protein
VTQSGINDLESLFGGLFGFGAPPPDSLLLRLLGLSEMPRTQEDVRTAFRSRMRDVHPDSAAGEAATDAVTVTELMWAREALLRKIPAGSDGTVTVNEGPDGNFISRNGRKDWSCVVCHGDRRMLDGEPYRIYGDADGRRLRWVGYCWACASDAENERQRELRRLARANRRCEACGETFTLSRSDARFCSAACRQRHYRAARRVVPVVTKL